MTRLRTIHVLQGEQVVSRASDVQLVTVLGSCVAACIFDPFQFVGGMNHFLLPPSKDRQDIRHAPVAMERLINRILAAGALRSRLRAKLFGGARMLPGLPDIGLRNAEAALAFLRAERIICEASDLGRDRARRIRFWPTTGRVEVSYIDRVEPLISRERPIPLESTVELF